ncbi:MAG: glycosyltransferase family 2 protein [Pedobacter sp.]|nr:MAG: glycosyltransferase family 2 protein [Pedobacter sp.]
MQFAFLILLVFHILVCFYLIYPFILYCLQVFNRKVKNNIEDNFKNEADYAIIVTAYEQTTLIPSVVESILKLNYENFLVYIVADNCDVSELNFSDNKIIVLRPEEVLASNVRSHFYAINNFKRAHDRLTIIDSDNLVHPAYLNELDSIFSSGYKAVQGVRKAKNLNTQYACLDEAGDIYYRFIDRKLLFGAGSSASLAGSGMAFTTNIYVDCMQDKQSGGAGFDKVLQFELLTKGERIAFAEEVIVYDEKTAKTDQLVKQRARWINTWFKFFLLGLKLFFKSLKNLNLNQFLFSLMLLRPPLFILLFLCGLLGLTDIFFFQSFLPVILISVIAFVYIFFKALSYFKAPDKIYTSLKTAPKFIFYQVIALFKAKNANKLSVATKHEEYLNTVNVNDVENEKHQN